MPSYELVSVSVLLQETLRQTGRVTSSLEKRITQNEICFSSELYQSVRNFGRGQMIVTVI